MEVEQWTDNLDSVGFAISHFRLSQIQHFGISQIQLSGLSQIARPNLKIHNNKEENESQGEYVDRMMFFTKIVLSRFHYYSDFLVELNPCKKIHEILLFLFNLKPANLVIKVFNEKCHSFFSSFHFS